MSQVGRDPYHDRKEWSNSKLGNVKALIKGRSLFKCSQETLDFGSQVHEAILEPYKYAKMLITEESYKLNMHVVRSMFHAGRRNSVLRLFLDNPLTKYEQESYFTISGFACRMKSDIILGSIVGDIKTTDATSREEFEKRALEYGYNRQGAFYLDGTGCEKFIIFAISKAHPHRTFTYVMTKDDPKIEQGRREYMELLEATKTLTPEQLQLL